MKTLGLWIKTCRKNAGRTQEQSSEALHISVRKYQGWEANDSMPTEDDLLRMEEYFENPIFAIKAMEIKSPIWKQKAMQETTALVTLYSIQTQLAVIIPQLIAVTEMVQSPFCFRTRWGRLCSV